MSDEESNDPSSTPSPKAMQSLTDRLAPPFAVVLQVGRYCVTARQAEVAALLAATVIAGILLFKNLGDQYLWTDEPQTAVIAKAVLACGLPRGHDDKNNSFSNEQGRDFGPGDLSRFLAWLPFYVVAGSFWLLGVNTLAARLPFALAGLATVPLCYFLARRLWQSRRAAALAALLLATLVPFLVLSRSCWYYSFGAFFALLGLLSYNFMVERKRWGGPLFVVAAILLFHSHFPFWPVLLATVLVHATIYHRGRFAAVARWSACTVLLNLPWLIWLVSSSTMALYPNAQFSIVHPFVLVGQYALAIFQHVFPPLLMACSL